MSAYWHWKVSFIEEFYVKRSVRCNLSQNHRYFNGSC